MASLRVNARLGTSCAGPAHCGGRVFQAAIGHDESKGERVPEFPGDGVLTEKGRRCRDDCLWSDEHGRTKRKISSVIISLFLARKKGIESNASLCSPGLIRDLP